MSETVYLYLSPDEKKMIQAYRQMSPEEKVRFEEYVKKVAPGETGKKEEK